MVEKIIPNLLKLKGFSIKNAPAILAGGAVAGVLTTVIFAVSATPKAIDAIRDKECEIERDLTKKETFKVAAKYYIPTALSASLTIGAIIGATCIGEKRQAALAGAYALSEASLKKYENKIIEHFGEDAHKDIRNEIRKEKVEEIRANSKLPMIAPGSGEYICIDLMSGRPFKSNKNKLEAIKNNLNAQLMEMGAISLNDYYYELGLDPTYIGDALGYMFDENGLLSFNIESDIDVEGVPCLTVHIVQNPTPIHSY